MLVCTLGDLTLDVIVRLAGPIAVGGDTEAEIRIGPGGQAANVAAWSASLGARARFVGKTGADDAGELVRAGLANLGVDVAGPIAGSNGVICSLVSPDGERSMAADRGTAASCRQASSRRDGSTAATTSTSRGMRSCSSRLEPLRAAPSSSHARGASVSIDLASWSAIRDAGAEELRAVVVELAPDVVFANEDEERIVGGAIPGAAWILKRGERGCSFDGDERPALPVAEVVDSTGAGDALAAGWIVGGPDLALEAAARCVRQLGAMPLGSRP